MNAVVITVGDELLNGQVINSNAAWLSGKLFAEGFCVKQHLVIGDSEKDILAAFKSAWKNFNIVIVTGGLGPTHDDITKNCICKFFHCRLVLDKSVLRHVKSIFKRRGLPMAENNIGQAMIPNLAITLDNTQGTAPGLLIHKSKKVFCAIPGVPYEMKFITKYSLLPYLNKHLNKRNTFYITRTLHTIGISESLLSQTIGDIQNILNTKPLNTKQRVITKLAFLPRPFEVRLRVDVESRDLQIAARTMSLIIKNLKRLAGSFIYSYDESPIEKVVGVLLKKNNLTLSVAESCTGGLIASMITDVPGSSDYFLEGVTAYSNESKKKILGVKNSTLKKFGAVSEQTAIEMAECIQKISGSSIGISTTGIAGPAGAVKSKPVGLIYIGYSDKNCSFAKKYIFTKDRLRNKDMASKMALEIIRRTLLGIEI